MLEYIKIVTALLVIASLADARPNKVICYFGSWATYRPGDGHFNVENIEADICTHIVYTFLGINSDGTIRLLDPSNDKLALPDFNALKHKNPNLKTLIAIGGWNEGSGKFSIVAANDILRKRFAENALKLMQLYGFDGFDLDWEYPAQRDGAPYDKQNLLLLLETLRKTFDASGKKYLLTAAVAAAESSAAISYDIPHFASHLDFINLMAYDFHGSYDGVTGQNAPLYPSSVDNNLELNVDAAVKAWIAKGAPSEKIVLGMPVYGRSFTVFNPNVHSVNNPANQGNAGPYTGEAGMLGYNEICAMQLQGGWTEVWDDQQKVPYVYKGDQWVGFDNEHSIRIKSEYAIEMNLGGAMIWSIDTDDFRGHCGQPYPILSTINKVFFGTSNAGSNTTAPVEPITTTTTKPNVDKVCNQGEFDRDPNNCSIFYNCLRGNIIGQHKCPNGLYFNLNIISCDYPYNVPECT